MAKTSTVQAQPAPQNTASQPQSLPQPSSLKEFNKTLTNPKTSDYLQSVLGSRKGLFVNNIVALVSADEKLQKCTPMSIIYAGIKATALNLALDQNLGHAYIIPYNNTKSGIVEAQFQIGYKGLIQLALRTGLYRTINVIEVKAGELSNHNILTGEFELKAVANREKAETIGYAAYFALLSGFTKIMYMSAEDVKSHAMQYSQTYKSKLDYVKKSSKWSTDFDAMAKKTVLKLLLSKFGPLSVVLQNAIVADQAVIDENGNPSYVDNQPEDQTPQEVFNAVQEKKETMRVEKKQPDQLM